MLPGGGGVRVGGWSVTTAHGPITSARLLVLPLTAADSCCHQPLCALFPTCPAPPLPADAECDALKERLGVLTMPEQFYGANVLQLRHEASGAVLRFDALGALRGWLVDE